jgi:ketosteroid isomerase-like protein
MTDREAIKQTIQRAYDARGAGDIEGLMSAFHPEATFELAGSKEQLEIAGTVDGHSNVTLAMTAFIKGFDFLERTITDWIIDVDRVAVRSRVKAKSNPAGRAFTTDIVDLFKFKDGKIIELVEFADTALVKNLLS